MRRRELLACTASGFGGIATLGGCVAERAPIRRFAGESECDEHSLECRDQRCASDEEDEATIRFTDEGVTVEGLIRTPTPCHELELEPVVPDSDCDTLEVWIEVGRQEETICVQCLGVVEYEARLDLDGHQPDRVEVVYDRSDETVDVAAADR